MRERHSRVAFDALGEIVPRESPLLAWMEAAFGLGMSVVIGNPPTPAGDTGEGLGGAELELNHSQTVTVTIRRQKAVVHSAKEMS